MSKIIFLTFVSVMLLSPFRVISQEKDDARTRFDKDSFLKKRSAFITAELGLTPEEAMEFIPLCEELQQKKYEASRKCRKLTKDMVSKQNPTDAECLQAMDECLNAGVKEAELEKEYYEKFKKILSPQKLYKYKGADYKFMHEFMRGSPRDRKSENKNR